MFAFIKHLLFGTVSPSESALAIYTGLSEEQPLDRLFAKLERELNRLVEEATHGVVKTLTFAGDGRNALSVNQR
jgi:hypothetical protein